MSYGEAQKENFLFIAKDPAKAETPLEVLEFRNKDCCFELPVLAKTSGGDNFTDDKSSFIRFMNNGISGATMTLQKKVSGTWTDIATLNNNTYGTYYAFGFKTNQLNENLMGYLIEWKLVLAAHGEGDYRIKTDETLITTGTVNSYSFEYCLKTYTANRANGTVRADWFNTGIIGDPSDDTKVLDFDDLSWFSQMRFPDSFFGFNTDEHEDEYVRYQNGKQVWLSDTDRGKFRLITGRFPAWLHDHIKFNMLKSDDLKITDYNNNNPNTHIDRPVKRAGNYEPQWDEGGSSKLARVEIEFEQLYVNNKHKRC